MSGKYPSPPEILNPEILNLSMQSSGKKNIILVLRHNNLCVNKQKFWYQGLLAIKSIFF